MAYLIGTDEAGYGPNLGPLVITATAWQAPDGVGPDQLYERLAQVVYRDTPGDDEEHRLAIADSKALYTSGKGLARLETGVLVALGMLGGRPSDCGQLWRLLVPTAATQLSKQAGYDAFAARLPVEADPARIDRLTAVLSDACGESQVRLTTVRSKPVLPAEWNRLIDRHGTKGAALSHLTFELLGQLLETLYDAPVSVVCDKHGGRNQYAALLQDRFADDLVQVIDESRRSSVYRFGPPSRRVQIELRAKAETCLPVALASMFSKYLRELAMRSFNQFWRRHLPALRPTAGYPLDARRFKRDIASVQRQLGIDDRVLWRVR